MFRTITISTLLVPILISLSCINTLEIQKYELNEALYHFQSNFYEVKLLFELKFAFGKCLIPNSFDFYPAMFAVWT